MNALKVTLPGRSLLCTLAEDAEDPEYEGIRAVNTFTEGNLAELIDAGLVAATRIDPPCRFPSLPNSGIAFWCDIRLTARGRALVAAWALE